MSELNLQTGKYYQINGTKKVLYWDGEKWWKPSKDIRRSYGGWISPLEKQPTNIKTVKEVEVGQIGNL